MLYDLGFDFNCAALSLRRAEATVSSPNKMPASSFVDVGGKTLPGFWNVFYGNTIHKLDLHNKFFNKFFESISDHAWIFLRKKGHGETEQVRLTLNNLRTKGVEQVEMLRGLVKKANGVIEMIGNLDS